MMKQFFLFLTLLLFSLPQAVCAKVSAGYYSSAQIERYVENTPRKAENSVAALAKYLSQPFDDDYDKAKAIAFWIAGHISYDDYLYNNGSVTKLRKNYTGQSSEELLKSRVGICGDFTKLFIDLCQRAGVRASYITGYAYPSNRRLTTKIKANAGHSWNYFIYNGKRVYVDVTFMAKGTAGAKRGNNYEFAHKRALKNVARQNKYKSQVNDFDEYYFDFNYENEAHDRGYRRIENKF